MSNGFVNRRFGVRPPEVAFFRNSPLFAELPPATPSGSTPDTSPTNPPDTATPAPHSVGAAVGTAKRRRRRPYYTYVIVAHGIGLCKIGRTANVTRRLESLRRTAPAELTLVHIFHEDRERWLHASFRADRFHREWFRVTNQIRVWGERMFPETAHLLDLALVAPAHCGAIVGSAPLPLPSPAPSTGGAA